MLRGMHEPRNLPPIPFRVSGLFGAAGAGLSGNSKPSRAWVEDLDEKPRLARLECDDHVGCGLFECFALGYPLLSAGEWLSGR